MTDPFRDQKIQNWAAEFSDRDEIMSFPPTVREYAREIASSFLVAACRHHDAEPSGLNEADMKAGLLAGPARLALPEAAHTKVVDLCALFIEDLQRQGRMAGGRTLAAFVRALRGSYRAGAARCESASVGKTPRGKTFVKPGSKLGLNDPCPCGSGLKYKKCCKRLLE